MTATKPNGKAAGAKPSAAAARSAPAAASKPVEAPKKEIPLVAGSLWAKKLEVPNGTITIKPKPAPAAAAAAAPAEPLAVTNAPAAAPTAVTTPLTASVPPSTTESVTTSPTPAASVATPTVTPAVTPAVTVASAPASAPAPTPAAATVTAAPAASTTAPAAVTPATTPAATVTAPSSFAAALRSKQAPAAAAATAPAPAPVAAAAPAPAVAKQQQQQPQQAAPTRAAKKKEAAAPAAKSAAAKAANAPLLSSAPAPSSNQQAQSHKPALSTNGSGVSVSVASAASSKFSLVPVSGQPVKFGSDRIRVRDGATRDYASRPRRDYFSSEHAPVPVHVPAGYTAYPLSPYPLFLLDRTTNVMTASLTALNNSTGQIEELANVSADCVPMVLVPSPMSGGGQLMPLLSLLATQLEYFFSVENLARDVYLRGLMDPSSGYVSLSSLLAFNRVQALTRSPFYLHLAAKHYCCASAIDAETGVATRTTQPLFKVKNGRVRVRANWRRYVFPTPADLAKRNANGATPDDGESSEEEDEVAASPSPSPSPVAVAVPAAQALDATKLQPPVDASVASTSNNTPVANSRADSPLTPTAATTSA